MQPQQEALRPFAERLVAAMLELRRNPDKRGIVGEVSEKYSISRRTVGRYKAQMKHELERDPPIADDVFRRMVLQEAEGRSKRQRGHSRYFTDFEEQMLVGILLGYDQSSVSMTEAQFCEFVRGILVDKFQHDPERQSFIQSSNLRSWSQGFRERNIMQLAVRNAKIMSRERAQAQDSAELDAWFAGINRLQQEWVQKGLLPAMGLQPYQVFTFEEGSVDPRGVHNLNLVVREKGMHTTLAANEQSRFRISFGCLANAEGTIVTTQLMHAQMKRHNTGSENESMSEGQSENRSTTATDTAPNGKLVVTVDDFLSTAENGWQAELSMAAFVKNLVYVLGEYRAAHPKCNSDTPMFIFLDNHFSKAKQIAKVQDLSEMCEQNMIEIVFLPRPLCRTLDQSSDGSLQWYIKAAYAAKLNLKMDQPTQNEEDNAVRQLDFNSLFQQAAGDVTRDAQASAIILAWFRDTGTLPKVGSVDFQTPLLPDWYVSAEQRQAMQAEKANCPSEDNESSDVDGGDEEDEEMKALLIEKQQAEENLLRITMELECKCELQRHLKRQNVQSRSAEEIRATIPNSAELIREHLARATASHLTAQATKRPRTSAPTENHDDSYDAPI